MKVKTSEASGVALDWLVAKALGGKDLQRIQAWHNKPWYYYEQDDEEPDVWHKVCLLDAAYSSDWSLMGPLIDEHRITIRYWDNMPFVSAYMPEIGSEWSQGKNALEAAARCFVASKLGEEVDVPEELV